MLAAVAVALLFPGSALAQEESAYQRGRDARLAGDPATAVELLDEYPKTHPGEPDALTQLGYAYLALGRLGEAEEQFNAVLRSAPNYTDAAEGLALIEQRRRNGEARRGFVLLEGALSALDGDLQDWNEIGVVLGTPIASRDSLDLRGSWYERFGLRDVELAALYTHRAGEDTWLRVGASGTPSADFRPEVALTAGIDRRITRGPNATVVGVDAAWRRFPAQDVFNVSPAITRYFGNTGEVSVTARANALIAEGDAMRLGGSLRADYAPAQRTRAFLGVAAGPDTDLGVVTDTYSVFGGGEVPFGDRLSLTGSIAREWRDGPADRTEFRLGLKVGW